MFSGRPNPRWSVGHAIVGELLAAWDRLSPGRGPAAELPPLGYRGCALRAPDGRVWLAAAATVTLCRPGQAAADEVVRDDPGHAFERRLLGTAPPGLLPGSGPGPTRPDRPGAGGSEP